MVLYDGLCGLCNAWVLVVADADRRGRLRYAPLQGTFGGEVLARHPELAGVDVKVKALGSRWKRNRKRR